MNLKDATIILLQYLINFSTDFPFWVWPLLLLLLLRTIGPWVLPPFRSRSMAQNPSESALLASLPAWLFHWKIKKCPCHFLHHVLAKDEQKQGYNNFFLRRLLADVVGGTSGTRWVLISQIWSASRYTSYFLILSYSSVLCNEFITVCNNKGMFAGISITRLMCKTLCVAGSIQNNQIKLSWYLAPIAGFYLKYSWYLTRIHARLRMCWR